MVVCTGVQCRMASLQWLYTDGCVMGWCVCVVIGVGVSVCIIVCARVYVCGLFQMLLSVLFIAVLSLSFRRDDWGSQR